jgi:protein-S-isoprenylcysteine O-methyltransferase Ste14
LSRAYSRLSPLAEKTSDTVSLSTWITEPRPSSGSLSLIQRWPWWSVVLMDEPDDIGEGPVCHNHDTVAPPRRVRFLDHRVPPLIVALLVGACMRTAVLATPHLGAPWTGHDLLAWSLAVLGVGVAMAGVFTFRSHQTTTSPFNPSRASTLVETGIYRRTRNPMYVGVTMALIGYAVYLAHPLGLALVAIFPAYMQRFQIPPEERALDQLFGAAYAGYKRRVPRWLL